MWAGGESNPSFIIHVSIDYLQRLCLLSPHCSLGSPTIAHETPSKQLNMFSFFILPAFIKFIKLMIPIMYAKNVMGCPPNKRVDIKLVPVAIFIIAIPSNKRIR